MTRVRISPTPSGARVSILHGAASGPRPTAAVSEVSPVGEAGPAPEVPPERSALLETRGALLVWDVGTDEAFPDATVDDPTAAASWLWEVYGVEVALAVHRVATTRGDPADGAHGPPAVTLDLPLVTALPETTVLSEVRDLAHLGWAASWWPASASVPPLSRALVQAEVAVLTLAVEHLLDDPLAADKAVRRAAGSLESLTRLSGDSVSYDAELRSSGRDLAARLRTAAEALGVQLVAPSEKSTDPADVDWALAAGTAEHDPAALVPAGSVVVATGGCPLLWNAVPAGVLDAEAEGTWSIVRNTDRSVLKVLLRAAPAPSRPVPESSPEVTLLARFGPDHLGIDLGLSRHDSDAGAVFTGSAVLPTSALLLPPSARTLRVWCPDTAVLPAENPGDTTLSDDSPPSPAAPEDLLRADRSTETAENRRVVLAHARARLVDPRASLAERCAGRARHEGWTLPR